MTIFDYWLYKDNPRKKERTNYYVQNTVVSPEDSNMDDLTQIGKITNVSGEGLAKLLKIVNKEQGPEETIFEELEAAGFKVVKSN